MKKIILTLALVLVAFVGMNAEKVTTRLYIPEMECNNCKAKVEKSITYVKGVKDLQIDLEKRIATVTYDDAKTNIAQIQKTLLNDTKFKSQEVKKGCPNCKDGKCTGACKSQGEHKGNGEAHQHGEGCGHNHEGEHKCSGEGHQHGEACTHNHGGEQKTNSNKTAKTTK
ncbi:MAG: cation transporter [Bacteroidales bacterium]|nr:cation transporter [Bacteroidales bacterium]